MAAKKGAKKAAKKKANSATLTLANVKSLAGALIDVADRYPTTFITERDFYPLVVAFLSWKLNGLQAEASVGGREAIDFKIAKTTNPAYLELAVAPRVLGDVEAPSRRALPNKTQLYASANESELNKLSKQGKGTKGRFLLLVDLRKKPHTEVELEKNYRPFEKTLTGPNPVKIVYAHRDLLPEVVEIDMKQPKPAKKWATAKSKKAGKPKKP